MCPSDPRYVPTPELIEVPVEPASENTEELFWEKNAGVPVEKIVQQGGVRRVPSLPN